MMDAFYPPAPSDPAPPSDPQTTQPSSGGWAYGIFGIHAPTQPVSSDPVDPNAPSCGDPVLADPFLTAGPSSPPDPSPAPSVGGWSSGGFYNFGSTVPSTSDPSDGLVESSQTSQPKKGSGNPFYSYDEFGKKH
jgi:hypothetical protein